MMDDADKAALQEEQFRQNRIDHMTKFKKPNRTVCVDCGRSIPPERLRILSGVCRCVACQEQLEKEIY